MSLWISSFIRLCHATSSSWTLILYAATWTTLLALTVAVASFSPEMAFVSAVSPSSSFSQKCKSEGFIRVPLDVPGDILCFPSSLFSKSKLDLIIPPVFAAVTVAASVCVVRALVLWG